MTLTVNDGHDHQPDHAVGHRDRAPRRQPQPKPGHTALVPDTARTNWPRITSGEIWDIEVVGNRVFIAGGFSSITNNASGNTTTVNQAHLAAYNINTGLVDTTFRPTFGGGGVNAVEASPDGTKLYVGGTFNTVNGVTKRKIASLEPDDRRADRRLHRQRATARSTRSRSATPPCTSAAGSPPSTAWPGWVWSP